MVYGCSKVTLLVTQQGPSQQGRQELRAQTVPGEGRSPAGDPDCDSGQTPYFLLFSYLPIFSRIIFNLVVIITYRQFLHLALILR